MTKLIGFGASTMEGVGDSQGGFFKRIGQKLGAAGAPRECLNFGMGGHTTRHMVARFGKVRPHLPCAALVVLGCNDLPRERDASPEIRISVADYTANLVSFLPELRHPGTIFISSFRVCPERTGIAPSTFGEYMGAALGVANSLGLRVWDLYAISAELGDKYLAPDGLHYGDAGHEFMAESLSKMILA